MRGMRSFDSVLTCSGWGFSHMGRFRPLRMTVQKSGWLRRHGCGIGIDTSKFDNIAGGGGTLSLGVSNGCDRELFFISVF